MFPWVSYGKIRLEIAENQASGSAETHVVVGEIVGDGESTFEYFKLPSGKIDLNFRGGVHVSVGSTIVVSVDIDCEKSIHVSGNHKNFRPVVFVHVELADAFQLCPRMLHGTIESLVLGEDDQTVVGFNLAIPHSNISVPILLDEIPAISMQRPTAPMPRPWKSATRCTSAAGCKRAACWPAWWWSAMWTFSPERSPKR